MLESILRLSIGQRGLIMVLVLLAGILGAWNFTRLPIDAVPDITNVQVTINTSAPGYTPLEVEQRVSFPIENAMAGLPLLDYTRSLSRYGFSQITVVFQEGTDIYFARQQVGERLNAARAALPAGLEPALGPIATGLGEIFMFTVDSEPGAFNADGTPVTPTDLRTVHDWIIRPQLLRVPGVVEVNPVGGFKKEILVAPDPARLLAYGVTYADVLDRLRQNNDNRGAGVHRVQRRPVAAAGPGPRAGNAGPGRGGDQRARRRTRPDRRRRRGPASAASFDRARPPRTAVKW